MLSVNLTLELSPEGCDGSSCMKNIPDGSHGITHSTDRKTMCLVYSWYEEGLAQEHREAGAGSQGPLGSLRVLFELEALTQDVI